MPTTYSTSGVNKGPQVSLKADFMGVGIVGKLSPTRAVIINKPGDWILVTPKETFDDSTLDLTEKLSPNLLVAYKANRTTHGSTYKGVAIFLRAVSECESGDAKMSQINKSFAYAESTKYGSIFFPVSAIKESIINESYMRRCRDLSKCLHLGDTVSFVAISDASTKNRSSYAVDIHFTFNQNDSKPMIGIVVDVSPSTCTVWARNFPRLFFRDYDFEVDASIDLRDFFKEGDRITFQANKLGCGTDGISNIRLVDKEKSANLQRAKITIKRRRENAAEAFGVEKEIKTSTAANVFNQEIDSGDASRGYNLEEDEDEGGQKWDQRPQAAARAIVDEAEDDDGDVMRMLEDELDSLEMYDDDDDGSQKENGAVGGGGGGDHTETDPKTYVDAEVQVCNMFEFEAMKALFEDMDIFGLACQRFPDLVRDMIRAKRN